MKTFLKISLFFLLLTQIQYSQWVQVGPPGLTIYSLATSGSNVFAGTYLNGLYRSTDDGQTWAQTSLDTGTIFSIAISGSYVLAGGYGVYISSDNGQTWTQLALNFPIDHVHALIADGSNVFAGTHTGVFLSIDNGQTWKQTALNNQFVYSLAITGSNIFAGIWSANGVYRSTDYGQTWTQTTLNSIGIQSIAVNGSNVIAGTWEEGLYLSSDNGETWLHTNSLYHIPALLVHGSNVFAGEFGVYRSTNNGQTWTGIGLPNYTVLALSISDEYIFAGRVLGLSVWRRPLNEITPVELSSFSASIVNSEIILNWTTASEMNNQGFEIESSFDNQEFSKIGFVAGFGTTTEAKSYSFLISDATAEVHYYRLKQIDFDGSFSYSTSIEVDGSVPANFELHQNYPNPFNPTTKIGYAIPHGGLVSLKVYNSIGEEIATLVDELQQAGSYEVNFALSGLASGIYLYRLTSGDFTETKQMVLLK